MYQRRQSTEARVGGIGIGGQNPIRIQSMGTVDTNNTEGCVAQAKRIIDAGGELVRFTTQGVREDLGSVEGRRLSDTSRGRCSFHGPYGRCRSPLL